MEDDDVTVKVFAVVAGVTSEKVTFEVSVIDVAVDDNVTFGAVKVLEVRTCNDVSSGEVTSEVCAFVGTAIYNGKVS